MSVIGWIITGIIVGCIIGALMKIFKGKDS